MWTPYASKWTRTILNSGPALPDFLARCKTLEERGGISYLATATTNTSTRIATYCARHNGLHRETHPGLYGPTDARPFPVADWIEFRLD